MLQSTHSYCYGITIWGSACNTYLTHIHITQKTFLKLVTNKEKCPSVPGPLAHTPPLFHELKILTIFDIYRFQVGKLFYESLNSTGPSNQVIKLTKVSEMHIAKSGRKNHFSYLIFLGSYIFRRQMWLC